MAQFFSQTGSADTRLTFPVGQSLHRADRIVPVFLPFAGCPRRCVFCAQHQQTGQEGDSETGLREAAMRIEASPPGRSLELAFYGGTFTSLPPRIREEAFKLYLHGRALGKVRCGRCSTRPDALGEDSGFPALLSLADKGLDLVELGIQTFDNNALIQSRRGYDADTAIQACRTVRSAGLHLGIQLLPGMPGVTPEVFLKDVDLALELSPDCLRFYPCLVPDGTELADMWKEGRYSPWTEEESIQTLGEGLRRAWTAGVPVIRLSVAPEASFDAVLLAGPRHPALGSLIQAEALLRTTENALRHLNAPPKQLRLPRSCQGYMYGQHGVLRPRWAAMGLPPERIFFTDQEYAVLYSLQQHST